MKFRNLIKSSFNEDESFTYDETPKHFGSITDRSIRRIRKYCLRSISEKYHGEYTPPTLESMLESIGGAFDPAYATLMGDYNARYTNLKNAYAEGIAELYQKISQAEADIDQHNIAFKEYAMQMEQLTGNHPTDQTIHSSNLDNLRSEYQILENKGDQNVQ